MKTQTIIFIMMAFFIFSIMSLATCTVSTPNSSKHEPEAASASANADGEADGGATSGAGGEAFGEGTFGEGSESESAASSASSSSQRASESERGKEKETDDGANNGKKEESDASSKKSKDGEFPYDFTVSDDESWFDPVKPVESLKKRLREASKTTNNKEAFLKASEVAQTIRKNELHHFGDDGEGKNAEDYDALLKEAERIASEYGKDFKGFKYEDQPQGISF